MAKYVISGKVDLYNHHIIANDIDMIYFGSTLYVEDGVNIIKKTESYYSRLLEELTTYEMGKDTNGIILRCCNSVFFQKSGMGKCKG